MTTLHTEYSQEIQNPNENHGQKPKNQNKPQNSEGIEGYLIRRQFKHYPI